MARPETDKRVVIYFLSFGPELIQPQVDRLEFDAREYANYGARF